MPEMPEVQAHAERLTEEFRGQVLKTFVPITFTALKTAVPAPDAAYGEPLVEVGRRLSDEPVDRQEAVLVGERELLGAHEGHRVLAECRQRQLHRREGAERVAVRVLVPWWNRAAWTNPLQRRLSAAAIALTVGGALALALRTSGRPAAVRPDEPAPATWRAKS